MCLRGAQTNEKVVDLFTDRIRLSQPSGGRGGLGELAKLRGEGVIKAAGIGVNEADVCVRFAERCDVKRSGSNRFGSSQKRGWRWVTKGLSMTIEPAAMR